MLFLAILGLFHLKLFSTIVNYFWLCEVIVRYFWLLKVISPYVIIGYFKLYYHRLFVIIPLVVIVVYSISGYWWLLY
jgi:hypothetical protein